MGHTHQDLISLGGTLNIDRSSQLNQPVALSEKVRRCAVTPMLVTSASRLAVSPGSAR